MGISGIASTGRSMSVMQTTSANVKDQKSKSIQNEITDVQQKLQKLSSENELSVNEKENERQKLQKEKSSLDNELKQHQEELLRSQKREAMLAELREAQNPAKEEDAEDTAAQVQTADVSSDETDKRNQSADGNQPLQPGTVISESSDGKVILKEVLNPAEDNTDSVQAKPADETREPAAAAEEPAPEEEETDTDPANEFRPTVREMQAMVSADSSMEIASRQGTLVTKTDDGIAVLKGEIKQDEARGVDTERKQAELKEMQKQKQQEMAAQFSMLGAAGSAMQAAMDPGASVTAAQSGTERNFHAAIA